MCRCERATFCWYRVTVHRSNGDRSGPRLFAHLLAWHKRSCQTCFDPPTSGLSASAVLKLTKSSKGAAPDRNRAEKEAAAIRRRSSSRISPNYTIPKRGMIVRRLRAPVLYFALVGAGFGVAVLGMWWRWCLCLTPTSLQVACS